MKISRINGDYLILLSRHELKVIKQCFSEALAALKPHQFRARAGVDKSEVEGLLEQMTKAYQEL